MASNKKIIEAYEEPYYTEARHRKFKAALWGAKDKDLAALYVCGKAYGTLVKKGLSITTDEVEAISRKIKHRPTFDKWVSLFRALVVLQDKVLLIKENGHKINNFMQAMTSIWLAYENIGRVFNGLIDALETNEDTKNTKAAKIVQSTALFELNEAVVSFEREPIVWYSVENGRTVLDPSSARKALEEGAKYLWITLADMKGYSDVMDFVEDLVAEDIPEIFTATTKRYIDTFKKDLSLSPAFSYQEYNRLLAEGREEEAKEIEERFIYPDYSKAERNEDLYRITTRDFKTIWN